MENEYTDFTQDGNNNKQPMQDALQRVADLIKSINDGIRETFSNQEFQNTLKLTQNIISESVKRMTESLAPVLKNFSEAMIPFRYIYILEESKWPLFLICDDKFRQDVISAYNANPSADTIKQLAFDFCSEEFLAALEQDWKESKTLSELRKPILSEAMLMHNKGFYYASTSMLMCQVYGVASDVVDVVKKNHLELNDEAKDYAAEHLGIRREDIDKEKGRLLQTVFMTESGQLLWDAMATYLQSEILCSSESKKRWETQPLRNKICHGDQLNFGTKEHSLKAILTIDMLVQLAYEINRIAGLQKNANESKEGADANGQQVD